MIFFQAPNLDFLQGLPQTQEASLNPYGAHPAQSQYIDQAITPPQKFQTTDQMNQQLNGANYQNFRENFPNPTPSISPREFGMQKQIYEQKLIYDDAQKKLAEATSDQERGRFQKVMDDAATSANLLRQNAQNLGWNTTGFNADNSLGEAVQRMNLNRNRGAYEVLDMPSTSAQLRSHYQQLLDKGVSPSLARAATKLKHDEFRESNIQKLMEGFNAYGLNPDGSVNEFGQMIAQKLYGESPYADKFISGYASPRDNFNRNAALEQITLAQDAAMARQLAQLQSAENIADKNLGLQKSRLELDMAKFLADENYRGQMIAQNNLDRESKTPTGTYNAWLEFGKMAGLPEEETKTLAGMAVENLLFGGRGKSSSSDGSSKTQQNYDEITNIINNQYLRVKDALRRKDTDAAAEILSGIELMIGDTKFNNIGLLTADDYQYILAQQEVYRRVISGELTLEEAEKLMGKVQPSNYKGENDQALADEMNRKRNSGNSETATDSPNETNSSSDANRYADEYARSGVVRIDNPTQYQEPHYHVAKPNVFSSYSGMPTATDWENLTDEQRAQIWNSFRGGNGYRAW